MRNQQMCQVEESINKIICGQKKDISSSRRIYVYKVDLKASLEKYPEGESLYSMICRYIRRMRKPYFIKKSGKLDEAGFYTYARIDKSTWSNIRLNTKNPNKETLLKLILALQLNLEEAKALMNKASSSLTDTDPRDRIVMALIDCRCYTPEDIYEIMEEYGQNGAQPFKNIY